ncbi:MAG: hypothetical protein KDE20_00095 [Caldilineaceae bacterium]|nr:hypothetical protein [Caldilineaceae bacterium]MCB0069816.1 hypothetical protein [Caldilineaceae bacterium]
MFVKIAGRKSETPRFGLTLALVLLLCSFALPAAAAPPQDLSFTFDVIYSPIPTDQGVGTWSSGGLFSGSGVVHETYVVGGFDNCWKTIHTTSVLTGPTPEDTITIRMQVVRIEEGPPLPPPLPSLCSTITADGNWVVQAATGIYAGLHGRGEATISAEFQPNPGGFLELFVHSELQGGGHSR